MTIARQQILQWPGHDQPCPKCRGSGDVYYLQTRQPDVEIIGGRRIICPACAGVGTVRASESHAADAHDEREAVTKADGSGGAEMQQAACIPRARA